MNSGVDISKFENKIALIIPAYEPDERFIELLKDIRKDFTGNIVVVNDGSGKEYDHFYEVAKEYGCDIVIHYENMGKGRSLKDAFNYALINYPDLIGCVTADSDGQHVPNDIYRCMDALYNNPECFILGCRDFSGDDVPFRSKLGNGTMKILCRFMCGIKVADTQTGLRGISKDFMRKLLNVRGERFDFETRMLIAAKDNFETKELFIETVYESKNNHKSHFNTIKDSIPIARIFATVFLGFLLSSVSSTVIDLWLFHMLCPIFKAMNPVYYIAMAVVCARVVSAVYNYMINYKLVFKSSSNHLKAALRYFVLALIQMTLSAVLTTVGARLLQGVSETLIKAIIDGLLFFASFCIQRSIVFK